MKAFFYISIIFLLVSCKKPIKNITPTKTSIIDTVSNTDTKALIKNTASTLKIPEIKYDTIVKVSKPFELNGILCYWENYIVYQKENVSDININLKNYKNKQILLNTPVDVVDSIDYKSDEYFHKLNNDYFEDLNFDGFKDFYYYSKGSMAMTSLTNIYLFNNKTKLFEDSEYLNAISVDKIDKVNKRLITTSFDSDSEETKTHYFDKFGKLKYTEVVTEYFNPYDYKIYEKIINGEVVKRDSTFISKE